MFAVYLIAVQKMAQAHIKSPDTPSSESSDNEDVSLSASRGDTLFLFLGFRNPTNVSKSWCNNLS